MKKFFAILFTGAALQLQGQNVGIGNTDPAHKLDLSGRMRIRGGTDLFNSAGVYLGGVGSESLVIKSLMGMASDTSVGFYGYGGGGWGFTMDTRNGNTGIGEGTPLNKAGFTVNNKVGAVNAIFGSNTSGIAIESNFPVIGFNTYYDGGRRAIANGYGGYIAVNPSGGGMQFGVSSAAGTTGNLVTVTPALHIKPGGNIGIGNTDPQAQLQFSNLVQNRKIVLYTVNNNDHQFYGFGINGFTLRYQVQDVSDNHVFYAGADASQSNELFRISGNGNVGVGVSDPAYRLDVGAQMRIRHSPGNSAGIWLNNSTNNATPAYIGMNTDNQVGFYGNNGAGWGFTMNTQNGALNLSGNAGQTNQVITSNNNTASAWKGLADLITTIQSEGSAGTSSSAAEIPITNATLNFTVSQNTKVLAWYRTRTDVVCLFGPCPTAWKLRCYLNGNLLDEFEIYGQKKQFGLADDVTQGPTIFEVPPGSHSLSFTCQRDWEMPVVYLKTAIILLGH